MKAVQIPVLKKAKCSQVIPKITLEKMPYGSHVSVNKKKTFRSYDSIFGEAKTNILK